MRRIKRKKKRRSCCLCKPWKMGLEDNRTMQQKKNDEKFSQEIQEEK